MISILTNHEKTLKNKKVNICLIDIAGNLPFGNIFLNEGFKYENQFSATLNVNLCGFSTDFAQCIYQLLAIE